MKYMQILFICLRDFIFIEKTTSFCSRPGYQRTVNIDTNVKIVFSRRYRRLHEGDYKHASFHNVAFGIFKNTPYGASNDTKTVSIGYSFP